MTTWDLVVMAWVRTLGTASKIAAISRSPLVRLQKQKNKTVFSDSHSFMRLAGGGNNRNRRLLSSGDGKGRLLSVGSASGNGRLQRMTRGWGPPRIISPVGNQRLASGFCEQFVSNFIKFSINPAPSVCFLPLLSARKSACSMNMSAYWCTSCCGWLMMIWIDVPTKFPLWRNRWLFFILSSLWRDILTAPFHGGRSWYRAKFLGTSSSEDLETNH